MASKQSKKYIEQFNQIKLTQPLAHNTYIQQIYNKKDNGWELTYSSTSVYHICPYDGIFRSCKECGGLDDDFDINFCLKKIEHVSSGALVGRIIDCVKANLKVEYLD